MGTDGRLPVVADFDRGAHSQGSSFAGGFAATAAGLTGTSVQAKRLCGHFSHLNIRELLMSGTDGEFGIRNLTDKATYERLEKDVAAVKNDISALTEQITDALNSFAGTAEQTGAPRLQAGARQCRFSRRRSLRTRQCCDGCRAGRRQFDRRNAGGPHPAAAAGDRRARARSWFPDRRHVAQVTSRYGAG